MNNQTQNIESAEMVADQDILVSHNLRDEWLMLEDLKAGQTKTPLEWFIAAFAVTFGIWHILTNLFLNEPGLWQNAIHFAGFAFLASTIYSAFGRKKNKPWAIKLDILYGVLVAASALWPNIYGKNLCISS